MGTIKAAKESDCYKTMPSKAIVGAYQYVYHLSTPFLQIAFVKFCLHRQAKLLCLSRRNRMKTELLRLCQNCEEGRLHKDVRNVKVTRKGLSVTVKNIAGLFCDQCDEIEFDDSTDSAQRYAVAGDKLVLQHRAKAAATLKLQRRRLKLTQAQASILTGGGHNAFSRYETGAAQPVPAVFNLFSILDKHPELLKDLNV